ncbi:DM13 domain-containing protein [Streptomyces sp. NPDC058611]|uniref:DM13 domain-containing protein n=1 Tax=unclassified Streptomyces TaxID=2593676 RepID=UPI003667DFD3
MLLAEGLGDFLVELGILRAGALCAGGQAQAGAHQRAGIPVSAAGCLRDEEDGAVGTDQSQDAAGDDGEPEEGSGVLVVGGPAEPVRSLLQFTAAQGAAAQDVNVSLGKLKGNKGDQNYTLPPDLDLSQYTSLSIWCDRFDVSFGAAALAKA